MKHASQNQPNVRQRVRKGKPDRALVDGQEVVCRPIDGLHPYAKNARRHSAKQIGQLKNSISAFGFMIPIIVDSDGKGRTL